MSRLNKRQRGESEQGIRARLLQAIFEQRMPPGARLTEEALAQTFNVSRTVIRQVIARLAQDGILVKSQSGATHVASPTRQEAKQILMVRRMIEPEIAKTLAINASKLKFGELYQHLEAEDQARKVGDRGSLVRLTGEFHLHLARLTENDILVRLMTELQALICLAILLYANGDDACPADDHRRIVAAIAKHDSSEASTLMLKHLNHIEKDLRLHEEKPVARIAEALSWLGQETTTANS